jgi:hypothetical protein
MTLEAFAGFEPWLTRLNAETQWPDVAAYRDLLGADVDFAPLVARLPAGLDASDVVGSYIGRCAGGVVPTRPQHLHDLMNALTWARYPLAKRALCLGQIDVAIARGEKTNRLRTPLQDSLAMLDEGGLLVVVDADDAIIDETVFGHGHLENAVQGRPSRGWPLVVRSVADADVKDAIVAYIDHAVAVRRVDDNAVRR